jgi:hypothetical protein
MSKDFYSLYKNLAESDKRIIAELKKEYEANLGGVSVSDEFFVPMYIQARYLTEFNVARSEDLKAIHLQSKGRLPKASSLLYKKFSRNRIDPKPEYNPIINQISDKGYYVVENFLKPNEVDQVLEELDRYEFYAPMQGKKPHRIKDLRNERADQSKVSTYYTNCTGNVIPADSRIGHLMINPFMADVASSYFQTQSYLTQAVSFFTRAKDPKLFTAAEIHGSAQKWHIDFSDFRFLKFFIALTDVNPGNGPHTFGIKTHEENLTYPTTKDGFHEPGFRIYSNGLLDGNVTDEWVNKNLGKDRIKEFFCPRGTLIIENTSGLHKGGDCLSGTREMLAFTYAVSNVTNPLTQPTLDYSPEYGHNSHLATVLKSLKQDQIDKAEAFKKKPSIQTRIKGKIKSLIKA